jgi:catechol 2,3-dioxygenase-like lactoylglutathione lyase family enzyme
LAPRPTSSWRQWLRHCLATAFYRDVLGLKVRKDEKGWKEFDVAQKPILGGRRPTWEVPFGASRT